MTRLIAMGTVVVLLLVLVSGQTAGATVGATVGQVLIEGAPSPGTPSDSVYRMKYITSGKVDGKLDDWRSIGVLATDPIGDVPHGWGYTADLSEVYGMREGGGAYAFLLLLSESGPVPPVQPKYVIVFVNPLDRTKVMEVALDPETKSILVIPGEQPNNPKVLSSKSGAYCILSMGGDPLLAGSFIRVANGCPFIEVKIPTSERNRVLGGGSPEVYFAVYTVDPGTGAVIDAIDLVGSCLLRF